jgi:hypothetical protein
MDMSQGRFGLQKTINTISFHGHFPRRLRALAEHECSLCSPLSLSRSAISVLIARARASACSNLQAMFGQDKERQRVRLRAHAHYNSKYQLYTANIMSTTSVTRIVYGLLYTQFDLSECRRAKRAFCRSWGVVLALFADPCVFASLAVVLGSWARFARRPRSVRFARRC